MDIGRKGARSDRVELMVVEVCGMSEDDEAVVMEVELYEAVVMVGTDTMVGDWGRLVVSSVSLSSCSLLGGGVQGWERRHFTWKIPWH